MFFLRLVYLICWPITYFYFAFTNDVNMAAGIVLFGVGGILGGVLAIFTNQALFTLLISLAYLAGMGFVYQTIMHNDYYRIVSIPYGNQFGVTAGVVLSGMILFMAFLRLILLII